MRLGFTITHRIQRAIKTLDRSWLFSAKEDKVGRVETQFQLIQDTSRQQLG
jgi:hypothetical protein